MKKSLSVAGLMSLILFSFSVAAGENDFDKVCNYFVLLQKDADLDKMTPQQRNDFVLQKVNSELAETSNARVAWEAIAYAVAEQRYELYKSSAEDVLKQEWSCPAMEELAHKTGEFK